MRNGRSGGQRGEGRGKRGGGGRREEEEEGKGGGGRGEEGEEGRERGEGRRGRVIELVTYQTTRSNYRQMDR